MDNPLPDQQVAPQWLLDMLDRSEADIAAGRTSSWDEVMARMTVLMAELDAEKARGQG